MAIASLENLEADTPILVPLRSGCPKSAPRPKKESPDHSGLSRNEQKMGYIFLAGAASIMDETLIIFLSLSRVPLTVTSLADIFAAPS